MAPAHQQPIRLANKNAAAARIKGSWSTTEFCRGEAARGVFKAENRLIESSFEGQNRIALKNAVSTTSNGQPRRAQGQSGTTAGTSAGGLFRLSVPQPLGLRGLYFEHAAASETILKPFPRSGEITRKEVGSQINRSTRSKEIWPMIALKFIALAMGARILMTFLSDNFGTNLISAIVNCLT